MKKLTYVEARQKFIDQGRNDILLLENGYVRWKVNAVFFDNIIGKEFTAIPHNVYVHHSSHPLRGVEKRKNTCLERFGATSSVHGTTQAGLLVKEKVKATCKARYGSENIFENKEVQNRSRRTLQQKYGIENISQLKKKRVVDSDQTVEQWLESQPEPKPASYQSFGSMFLYGPEAPLEYTVKQLEGYLSAFRSSKTKLERLGESLFSHLHFNRKPTPTISYRPDFKVGNDTYVNVDGLYWHSEKQKAKHYHFQVRKAFEAESLRIFQFHESEIRDKAEIVLSIVNNAIGKTGCKVYARKTIVKSVSQKEASSFLSENHMMGSIRGTHMGLFTKDNQLVSLLTYKCFKKKGHVCIERFCSKRNIVVVGGFSKLLKVVETLARGQSTPAIYYWVDLRYGTGSYLSTCGFEAKKETLGWKWSDGNLTYNRLRCRANMDERKLSEAEHAKELGWYRIYDAGQRLWVKSLV